MPAVAIKISEEVAELVRRAAKVSDRSMAGQIEHWAKLAMEVEDRATVSEVNAIKGTEGNWDSIQDEPLRERVERLVAEFRFATKEEIRHRIGLVQRAVYEPDSSAPGGVVRIEPDGTRIRGRIEGRDFVPAD